jgi:hypothetical protein
VFIRCWIALALKRAIGYTELDWRVEMDDLEWTVAEAFKLEVKRQRPTAALKVDGRGYRIVDGEETISRWGMTPRRAWQHAAEFVRGS